MLLLSSFLVPCVLTFNVITWFVSNSQSAGEKEAGKLFILICNMYIIVASHNIIPILYCLEKLFYDSIIHCVWTTYNKWIFDSLWVEMYMNSPAIQYTESSVFSVTVGGAGVHV